MFCFHLHHLLHTEVLQSEQEFGCSDAAPEHPKIQGQGCLPWGHQHISELRCSCWTAINRHPSIHLLHALLKLDKTTILTPGIRCTLIIPITFKLLKILTIPHSSSAHKLSSKNIDRVFPILSLSISGKFADLCFTTFFQSGSSLPCPNCPCTSSFVNATSTVTSLKSTLTCFINLWMLHSPSLGSLLKMDLLVLLSISGAINTNRPSYKWISHCFC